jgi:hypothetical protein
MNSTKPPTEIHCHLLPGVDDGARDLDESLEMAAVAAADGTRAIVVTPHVRSDFVTDVWHVRDGFCELRKAVVASGLAVDLHCGGELGHDLVGRLTQAELEVIAVFGAPWAYRVLGLGYPQAGSGSPRSARVLSGAAGQNLAPPEPWGG